MTAPRLRLSRAQILGHRRRVGALEERLPFGADSLRRAAWAGLSDSMPRSALLSIHARVAGTSADAWADPSLVQVWGPRFSAYVVPAEDRAVFTLGRLPDDAVGLKRAVSTADALEAFLAGRTMGYGEAGDGMGVVPNSLRYGAPSGRILIRWDGARQPSIWMVPAPEMTAAEAALELVRRYLHVFGPGTPGTFADWAGIGAPRANRTFAALAAELTQVGTPIGDRWILGGDEDSFRSEDPSAAPATRLLPSGDTWFLLQGADRELLVPDATRRPQLWTPRVWPGALLVDGEIAGIWRRAGADVDIEPWRQLSSAEREGIEAETASLPLPGIEGAVRVRWAG
jgi:hypothetical protein